MSEGGKRRTESGTGRPRQVESAAELEVYRRAYSLAMEIFQLSKGWPPNEQYSLTDQIRRSSRPVCANLREAWAKRRYAAHFGTRTIQALSVLQPPWPKAMEAMDARNASAGVFSRSRCSLTRQTRWWGRPCLRRGRRASCGSASPWRLLGQAQSIGDSYPAQEQARATGDLVIVLAMVTGWLLH